MIYTLKRDDIRLAAMIYQVCDLDKKILQKMYPFLQYFLAEKERFELSNPVTGYTISRSFTFFRILLLTKENPFVIMASGERSPQGTPYGGGCSP